MMITLELPADIEKELQEEATRQGVAPQQIVLDALANRLRDPVPSVPSLPQDEAALLQQINLGFSASWWARYEALKHKRRAETLTPPEHTDLIQMSDELEQANAHRFATLVELARLRGTSVGTLMHSLGLAPHSHE